MNQKDKVGCETTLLAAIVTLSTLSVDKHGLSMAVTSAVLSKCNPFYVSRAFLCGFDVIFNKPTLSVVTEVYQIR